MNLRKVKIAEATNLQLDWIVGTLEKAFRLRVARPIDWYDPSDNRWIVRAQVENVGWFADYTYQPSVNPAISWSIIDRERIAIDYTAEGWYANMYWRGQDNTIGAGDSYRCGGDGPTSLVAAMRCYCVSRLGEEAEVPEELV